MAYAELAALRPRAGGEYVYLRAAFGRLAAFLTGWTSFVAGFSGAIAASAVVLAFYVGRFVPAANDATPLLVIPLPFVPLTVSRQAIVALAAIGLMAWIHLRGVGPGRLVMNVLAGLKVSALLIFIALGFTIGAGSAANLRAGRGAGWRRRVAARAHPGDVHLLGMERRGVRRRGDSRSRAQRAARARARHAGGRRDLFPAEPALPLRAAGRRARAGEGQRARRRRRSAARRARRRRDGHRVDRQHRGEHQRDDVRRPARLLRDGARRPVLPRARRASIRGTTRRRRRSSRRRSGAACSCCRAAPTR